MIAQVKFIEPQISTFEGAFILAENRPLFTTCYHYNHGERGGQQ